MKSFEINIEWICFWYFYSLGVLPDFPTVLPLFHDTSLASSYILYTSLLHLIFFEYVTCLNSYICIGSTGTPSSSSSLDTTTITTITTTVDTPGTLAATSSYPNRQALDECGGICYPSSVPNGTTLSNCTLSFTGLISGVWYAVAIQVNNRSHSK